MVGQALALQLAQQPRPTGAVLLWVAVIIGVVLASSLLILIIRRRLLGPAKDDSAALGLMDQLRHMLQRGEITQDEFDRTRRAMVTKAAQARSPHTPAGPVTLSPATRPENSPDHSADPDEVLVARPGFDLTGAPLPLICQIMIQSQPPAGPLSTQNKVDSPKPPEPPHDH